MTATVNHQRTRILIVDDNDDVRGSLAKVLGKQDDMLLVGAASGVKEGVELAVSTHPDVVILDVSMPDGGGIEAARAMRRDNREIKIVAYSAFDQALITRVMRTAGASEYVSKASHPRELLSAVRRTARTPVGSR